MNVYIASDHGGFKLKNEIIKNSFEGYNFIDLGAKEFVEDDDYPFYAKELAKSVQNDDNAIGILVCRSGIGMSIAANKFKGIYAALCFTPEHAKKSKEHNNANVLCLDSDYGELQNHLEVVKSFFENKFEGNDSRHGRRIEQIEEIENINFNN